MNIKSSSQQKLRLDIQGLRAIAVLAVMIFHANKDWLPAGFFWRRYFFVISGFIISFLIFNSKDKSFNWSKFVIKRILPAYLVLLVITTLLALVIFIPQDFIFL